MIHQLAPNIVTLSLHKFASNVVEKCLTHCSAAERDVLVAEMLREAPEGGEDPLQCMMKDQFGNYVVQKVLEVRGCRVRGWNPSKWGVVGRGFEPFTKKVVWQG